MALRGSVIPLFVEQVLAGKPITVTDPAMTRFMMTLTDAVDLVLYAFEHGDNGDIFFQKSPAATVEVLTQAIVELMAKPDCEVRNIGTSRLDMEGMKTLLLKLDFMQRIARGEHVLAEE